MSALLLLEGARVWRRRLTHELKRDRAYTRRKRYDEDHDQSLQAPPAQVADNLRYERAHQFASWG
jgi:hypothetical protein